jgi:hypothetical protein
MSSLTRVCQPLARCAGEVLAAHGDEAAATLGLGRRVELLAGDNKVQVALETT